MRITNQMVTDANARYLSESLERVNKVQNQVNSGKVFENASDDPLAASFSLSLYSTLKTIKTYQDTAKTVDDWMTATDYAFQQMNDITMKAQNVILSGLNESTNAWDSQQTMATELDSMISQALDVTNTTQGGQYIFSGFKTDQKAFTIIDQLGNPTPPPGLVAGRYEIHYNGDNGQMQRNININQTTTQNVIGDTAFTGVLKSMVAAREALRVYDRPALSAALKDLQTTSQVMNESQGSSGSRWRQVQSTSDYLDKSYLETTRLLSDNEDINLAEGITMLRKQESNYQIVMEVTSRAISAMTLFDYLK